ncbi:MAG: hypothetical protein P8X63_11975 [Desulfuromonadaceae bacterium]|jgi:hypothetical protein
MKTTIKLVLAIALGCLLLTGCTGRPIHLDSVQQVDMADVDFSKGRQISVSASGFQLLLLIPIRINDRHERALQALRNQAGWDYIGDIEIQESWSYALVGTVYTTTLVATAYPKK